MDGNNAAQKAVTSYYHALVALHKAVKQGFATQEDILGFEFAESLLRGECKVFSDGINAMLRERAALRVHEGDRYYVLQRNKARDGEPLDITEIYGADGPWPSHRVDVEVALSYCKRRNKEVAERDNKGVFKGSDRYEWQVWRYNFKDDAFERIKEGGE